MEPLEELSRSTWPLVGQPILAAAGFQPAPGVSTFSCDFPSVHALYVGQELSPANSRLSAGSPRLAICRFLPQETLPSGIACRSCERASVPLQRATSSR